MAQNVCDAFNLQHSWEMVANPTPNVLTRRCTNCGLKKITTTVITVGDTFDITEQIMTKDDTVTNQLNQNIQQNIVVPTPPAQ